MDAIKARSKTQQTALPLTRDRFECVLDLEVACLPLLRVSVQPYPAEPEVGIFYEQLEDLDWQAAHGVLTPEQECLAQDHCEEIFDAIRRAYRAGGAL